MRRRPVREGLKDPSTIPSRIGNRQVPASGPCSIFLSSVPNDWRGRMRETDMDGAHEEVLKRGVRVSGIGFVNDVRGEGSKATPAETKQAVRGLVSQGLCD